MTDFNFIKNLNLITINLTDSRKIDLSVGKNSKKTTSTLLPSKRIAMFRRRENKNKIS